MAKEKIYIASNNVELSETKSYLELTTLMCYYDVPNENGVTLPYKDAIEKAQTLVNMPVVAKYKVINKKPDLGGHEAYIHPVTKEIEFDTDEIGTHTSVCIKDTEIELHGEKRVLPCLFSTSRIWTTRHKNTVKAIKRLYDEGTLTSSWEITVNAYEYKDGIKVLSDYSFDANCLLGSNSLPAYPCASVLDMASLEQSQLMIAEALTKDKEEDEQVEIEKENTVVTEDSQIENKNTYETNPTGGNSDTTQVETSAMTYTDFRKALSKACSDKVSNSYLAIIMADENYCLCDAYDLSELEFYKFDYKIENNTVAVSEPEKIKLVVSVAEINKAISTRDDEIIASNNTITELNKEISELKKYKDIVESIEAEKIKAENSAKIEKLKSLALTSGYISEKETLEDETIKTMIASLDEIGIKSLIVDRMLVAKAKPIETSEMHIDVSGTDSDKSVSAFSYYMNLN